ncbi:hypothetical protein DEU56DRAFT_983680 [Suillus clintonianus]|uniref:uncharacterized protein n=1 Tax=Suillus clintonianus TaxID=1904413 RepID=UPI001B865856|nr:uncharacterized protein DEU56DRAFT_983680 [Suillus clintonianus]KAG2124002.1 hypothetical protein DEU56DRAFT_983680 [Suillus clintonianus]
MSFDFSIPPAGSQPRALSSFQLSGSPDRSEPGTPLNSSLLMSPTGYQRTSESPPSSSRQPQIDPNLFADELSALFVDTLANQFGLGDAEQDLRKNLHGFAKLGHGLSKSDLATRTYLLGSIFCILKEQRMIAASHQSTQTLLADLQIRLEATFSLSPEQRTNIRIVGCDLIFDPNRITFMTLHFDVADHLREDREAFKLTNIYGNPARERFLTIYIKCQCSSIRNSFRELLRDSVIGDNTSTLSDFIYDSSNRFRRAGGNSDLGHATRARLAILRRFAYENPHLLDRAEEEDESPTTPSAEDNGEDSPIGEPAKKKRKRGQGGRIVKGEDFWSKVEMWFEARQKQWGDSWGTTGWSSYINQTIELDTHRYQRPVVQNLFMIDVIVPEAYRAHGSSAASLKQKALGSMEDILRLV